MGKKILSAEMDSRAWEVDCGISSVAYVPNLTELRNSSAFWSGPAKTEAPMSGTNLGKTENWSVLSLANEWMRTIHHMPAWGWVFPRETGRVPSPHKAHGTSRDSSLSQFPHRNACSRNPSCQLAGTESTVCFMPPRHELPSLDMD